MVRLIAALAVLVMAVSGCSDAVAGNAVQAPANNDPLTGKEMFGELSTVNYCSLLSADELPRDLGELLAPAAPALDSCFVRMLMKGARIEGRVGFLEDYDTIESVERIEDSRHEWPRGLRVYRGPENDDMCVRFLRFVDELWLTIMAERFENEEAKGNWCPLADEILYIAIDRVMTKNTVRHFIVDQGSVAVLNACDLVKPDVVAAKLGLHAAGAQRFPSGHECQWFGPDDDDSQARLRFGVRLVKDPEDATYETIAGRRTRVVPKPTRPDDDFSACLLEIEHIKSTAFASVELLDLDVRTTGKDRDACGPARELAAEIWASLPKP